MRPGLGAISPGDWHLQALLRAGAYAWRSRRSATALPEFAPLRERSFQTLFWVGAWVRVGYGALPFLLPLMLQIGLSFSALQSGLALLVSGAVPYATKTQTAGMLRRAMPRQSGRRSVPLEAGRQPLAVRWAGALSWLRSRPYWPAGSAW